MRNTLAALFALVRGGSHPRHVAVAVSLGLLAGFVSGSVFVFAAVLALAILLNATTRVLLTATLVGAALSWVLAPITFQLGHYLLDETQAGHLIARYRDSLGVVLFDLDRFTLLGGAALALGLALPAMLAAARLTRHARAGFQRDAATASEAPRGALIRAAAWSIYGRPEKALSIIHRPAPHSLLRPAALCLLATMAAAGSLSYGPRLIQRELLERMSIANQAQVDAAHIRWAPTRELLEITDLRIADPNHLDRDRLRVGNVIAVVRPGPLVRGRVEIERLLLEGVSTDVARKTRARPYGLTFTGGEAQAASTSRQAARDDGVLVGSYLKDRKAFHQNLACLESLIGQIERLAECEQVASTKDNRGSAAPPDLISMRYLRSDFGRSRPLISIKALRATALAGALGLGEGATVEISNLSSLPAKNGVGTTLSIIAPALHAELAVRMNPHKRGSRHAIELRAADVPLASLVDPARLASLKVAGGKVSLSGEGTAGSGRIDARLEIELTGLELKPNARTSLAGLSAGTWKAGIDRLGRLQTVGHLSGALAAPRLAVERKHFVEGFKADLLAAGETNLVDAIERETGRHESDHSKHASLAAKEPKRLEPVTQDALDVVDQSQEPANVADALSGGRYANRQPLEADAAADADVAVDETTDSTADASQEETPAEPAIEDTADANAVSADPMRDEGVTPVVGQLRYPEAIHGGTRAAVRKRTPSEPSSPPEPSALIQDSSGSRQRPQPRESQQASLSRQLPSAQQLPAQQTPIEQPTAPALPRTLETQSARTSKSPPPVALEIGYDDQQPVTAYSPPASRETQTPRESNDGRMATRAIRPSTVSPEIPAMGVPEEATKVYEPMDEEVAAEVPPPSRMSSWSEKVTGGVKRIWPFGKKQPQDDEQASLDAEEELALTDDEPAMARNRRGAVIQDEPADEFSDEEFETAEKPWYKFWR